MTNANSYRVGGARGTGQWLNVFRGPIVYRLGQRVFPAKPDPAPPGIHPKE